MARVRFPDGTSVQAVGIDDRDPENPARDFGLYFDPLWRPTWPAEVVVWGGLGVPQEPERAAAQICQVFARAQRGERVEIGCVGGLGRTGTALACMAILAGVPPGSAVAWVRTHYDPHAVDTSEQEDWVLWFASHCGRTP